MIWSSTLIAIQYTFDFQSTRLLSINSMSLLQFAILYGAAMHTRKQPEAHKRYMAVAGIVMTPPALVRLTRALGWGEAASLIFLFGFFAALLIYDRRQHGKFHPANLKGLGLVVLGIAFGPLAVSDWWGDFARSIFGK